MNLPNYLTIFRIFLTPILFSFIAYYNNTHPQLRFLAFIIFLIAIVTDALDGFLARHFHEQTELGTFLDPLADKLLLLSGILAITFSDSFPLKPPLWVVVTIVFRDLFILCGLAILFLTKKHVQISPNLLGKATTFFQMLTVGTLLLQWQYANWIWIATVVFTLASVFSYLLRGIRILNQ